MSPGNYIDIPPNLAPNAPHPHLHPGGPGSHTTTAAPPQLPHTFQIYEKADALTDRYSYKDQLGWDKLMKSGLIFETRGMLEENPEDFNNSCIESIHVHTEWVRRKECRENCRKHCQEHQERYFDIMMHLGPPKESSKAQQE